MRENEGQSELQILAAEFEVKIGQLKELFRLKPGERRGPLVDGIEHIFEDLETVVDKQTISQHGSINKIREAIVLVEEAIQEREKSKSGSVWGGDAGKYGDWLDRVRKLLRKTS